MQQDNLALSLICAFAAGSIPFGWIIAKMWGVADLRKEGSSNIGATNVVRTAGIVPGALTFIFDFLKGILPMLYIPGANVWIGLAAVLGHCFSPFLRFRGGKGVSTAFGAFMGFSPWLGLSSLLVYGVALAFTRVSALGSLFAMLTALTGALLYAPNAQDKLAVILIVAVVLARHRSNWIKLLGSQCLLALTVVAATAISQQAAYAEDKLVDFRGKPVETSQKPSRIAALMPSIAETVVQLVGTAKLVAAPDYSRLPKESKAVKLGPYNSISAEVVYATRPDLVLASMDGNNAATVLQLEKLGLRVLTINTQSLADIIRSMRIITSALGDPKNSKVERFARVLAAPPRKSGDRPPRSVLVQVGWNPIVTISKQTFIDELVRLAGGRSIFTDAPMKYPRPNAEEVLLRDPDIIVICQSTDDGEEAERAKNFWSQFKKLKAVREGKLYVMPVDWLTKPGFQLMDGVKELERILL